VQPLRQLVHDVPAILEFLKNHGTNFVLLDLNLSPLLDVRMILSLWLKPSTNADWRVHLHDDVGSALTSRRMHTSPQSTCTGFGMYLERACLLHLRRRSPLDPVNASLKRPRCGGAAQGEFLQGAAHYGA